MSRRRLGHENSARHDEAGLLCMANRGRDTGGSQFFIMESTHPHLDGSYSVFGRCAPTELVGQIARRARSRRDVPITPVYIQHITIHR